MVFLVRTKKSNRCHKRIEHHERRIANDIIHKITKEIVNRAIETDSSQTCRKCSQRGTRTIQGLFIYKKCGEKNADRNTAFNIAYRGFGIHFKVGVTVDTLKTFSSVDRNAMMKKEARKRRYLTSSCSLFNANRTYR